jgi:Subtilase family
MSNSRENFSRVVVILAFLTWFSGHFLVAVAATTGSYLRKSRSPSRYLNSFQQQLQVPRQEELQKMSQNMGATLSKRRRFYARYDSEEGRLLVQQLCGIGKIVEDLDTTNYTLFEDEDNDDNDDEDKGLPVSAMSATSCWKKLQGHTEIRWVEEDHPVRAFSIEGTDNNDIDESNDAMVSWGIGAVQADQLEVGPHGVTVCVVDTGIADHHPDFNYDRISGVDRIDRPTAWYWNRDRAGHGTHVSGIVAASSNNGYGIKGVGDFSLLIVRALGDDGTGFESDIWKAVETCIDHGANIINM